jgi:hypothetical protein
VKLELPPLLELGAGLALLVWLPPELPVAVALWLPPLLPAPELWVELPPELWLLPELKLCPLLELKLWLLPELEL